MTSTTAMHFTSLRHELCTGQSIPDQQKTPKPCSEIAGEKNCTSCMNTNTCSGTGRTAQGMGWCLAHAVLRKQLFYIVECTRIAKLKTELIGFGGWLQLCSTCKLNHESDHLKGRQLECCTGLVKCDKRRLPTGAIVVCLLL